MNSRINTAIILDSYFVPIWKYRIIEDIILSDFAFVSMIIINDNKTVASYKKTKSKTLPLVKIHQAIDRFVFRKRNDSTSISNLQSLVKNIPAVLASPELTSPVLTDLSFEYSGDICKEIRNASPDVILKLGSGLPSGEILNIPKYGLWAFAMDHYDTDKLGSSGYFEVVNKSTVSLCDLLLVGDNKESSFLLSRSVESTCSFSVHLTRERLFSRAGLMPSRILKGLNKYGNEYLNLLKSKYKEDENLFPEIQNPEQFAKQALYIWRGVMLTFKKIISKIFYSDPFNWILLFKTGANNFNTNQFRDYISINPSEDKFWADPFIIERDSKYFVFVEEFIYKTNKGHISVIELDSDGKPKDVKQVIKKDYHMSYPFVFESGGDMYMIPESSENRTIDIYKCLEFPGNWVFMKSLMKDICAFDTTLLKFNGKWWLFTLMNELKGSKNESPELFLFYSDDFMTDNWTSHPLNPIVSDIRTARPAGRLFLEDGKIMRPSQDCSGRYGRAFNYNQINSLSEFEYSESLARRVEPEWDKRLKGAHTFNSDKGCSIIDAYSSRFRRPFSFFVS